MEKKKHLLVALLALLMLTNYNANAQWQSMGLSSKLTGLSIYELDVHPNNPDIMLIGTNKGLWITTNGSADLSQSNLGLTYTPSSGIADICRAPSAVNIVYLASHNTPDDFNSGGVYKSTDGGITWKRLSGLQWMSVWSVTVHPTNSDWVFAAVQDGYEGGIWKTEDGNIFSKKLSYNGYPFITKVVYDLSDPSRLVAGAANGHTFVSTDGGESGSWLEFTDPTFNGESIWEMDMSQKKVLAGGNFKGLKRSEDNGKTWTDVGFSYTTISHIKKVSNEPGSVYWGTGDGELYGSKDFGSSWKNGTGDLPDEVSSVGGIARNKGWTRQMYIAVQPSDVYYLQSPSTPYDLKYQPIDSDTNKVTWKDSSEYVTYFDIERDGVRGYGQVPGNTTTFYDTRAVEGSFHQYKARSCVVVGIDSFCSPGSDPDGGPGFLAEPENCNIEVLSCDSIRITWTDVSTFNAGYLIERSTVDTEDEYVLHDIIKNERATSYNDGDLEPGLTYFYRIFPWDNGDYGLGENGKASDKYCNPHVNLINSMRAEIVTEKEARSGCPLIATIVVDLSGTSILIKKFEGTLSWTPTPLVLSYTANSGLLSGFSGTVDVSSVPTGKILFNGENPSGAGDLVEILTVEFNTVGSEGTTDLIKLNFSVMTTTDTIDIVHCLDLDSLSIKVLEELLLGDVNGDGLVNKEDARIIQQYSVGLPISDESRKRIEQGLGDLNNDGKTNSTDANIILTFELGLPVAPFPVGKNVCP